MGHTQPPYVSGRVRILLRELIVEFSQEGERPASCRNVVATAAGGSEAMEAALQFV
jgi:hypothetical protein